MTSCRSRDWGLAVGALLLCVSAIGGQQQDANARVRAQEAQDFKTAANRWMQTPVDVRAQTDVVSTAERQARDAYWDDAIGASAPLSQPNAIGTEMPLGDAMPNTPEFGDLGDGVWLIGKFEGYRTLLSASQRSVYTEIDLRVRHVFGHPNVPTLQVGTLIHVDLAGGTILAPWGSVLSYALHPQRYELQPNHSYLLPLGYHPSGNFYTGGGPNTVRCWDLTDGTVRPGSHFQEYLAAHGRSEVNGLKVADLIQLFDNKFADYYKKGH